MRILFRKYSKHALFSFELKFVNFGIHIETITFIFIVRVVTYVMSKNKCIIFLNTFLLTWLKAVFKSADKSGDGLLSMDEVQRLLHKMNVNLSKRKVKQLFKVLYVYAMLIFWLSLKIVSSFLLVTHLKLTTATWCISKLPGGQIDNAICFVTQPLPPPLLWPFS